MHPLQVPSPSFHYHSHQISARGCKKSWWSYTRWPLASVWWWWRWGIFYYLRSLELPSQRGCYIIFMMPRFPSKCRTLARFSTRGPWSLVIDVLEFLPLKANPGAGWIYSGGVNRGLVGLKPLRRASRWVLLCVCVCAIPNSQYEGICKGVEMSIVMSEDSSRGHRMEGLPYTIFQCWKINRISLPHIHPT